MLSSLQLVASWVLSVPHPGADRPRALQVFKSGDEDSDLGMSVEDYPSQEVTLRVQLQRAIEEERSAF